MENRPGALEYRDPATEIFTIKQELGQRLLGVSEVERELAVSLLNLSDLEWRNLSQILDDPDSTEKVNFGQSDSQFTPEQRISRLASLKANFPEKNIEEQKDKHNVSLENHIKLALQTSGDLATLRMFEEIVRAKIIASNNTLLAKQTLLIWAPAAEIAGWHELRTELEEVAFECLYPEEKKKIAETYSYLGGDEELGTLIEEYSSGLQNILPDEMDPGVKLNISGRKKSFFSVWRKSVKEKIEDYKLPDFVGMRIVVAIDSQEKEKEIEACYAVADILTNFFTPELDRYKDFIAHPKANGYQSLHLTIRDINGAIIEFQVRTKDMHQRAEYDQNMSHMIYDATYKITPGRYFRKLTKPHRIYAWRDKVAQEIRDRRASGNLSLKDLEPGTIFVFSSENSLYQLHQGNTALDLAFAMHSDRALRLQAMFLRGKPIKFDQPLESGDVVRVSYNRDKRPTWSDSWFNKVNSQTAIRRLQKARRTREAAHYIKLAELRVEEHFSSRGILNSLDEIQRESLARKYGVTSFESLLRGIGARTLKIGRLVYHMERYINPSDTDPVPDSSETEKVQPEIMRSYKDETGKRYNIAVLQTFYCHHHIAGCCSVEVGDEIVAVPSRLRGDFAIHKPDCVNLPDDPRKALDCTWHRATSRL